MNWLRVDTTLDLMRSPTSYTAFLVSGLGVLVISLLLMLYTRWGQHRALQKCLVLSLWAHILLAAYSTTISLLPPRMPAREEIIDVSFDDGPGTRPGRPFGSEAAVAQEGPSSEAPWESFAQPSAVNPLGPDLPRPAATVVEPKRSAPVAPAGLPGAAGLEGLPLAAAPPPGVPNVTGPIAAPSQPQKVAEKIEVPAAERRVSQPPVVPVGPRPARAERTEAPAVAMKISQEIPSALLEPTSDLPRVAMAPTAGDAPALLSGPVDSGPPPQHTAPAAIASTKPPAAQQAAGDPAYAGGQSDEASPGRMWMPSVAAVASRRDLEITAEPPSAPALAPPGLAPHRVEAKHDVPGAYRLRVAPDRAQLAQRLGGTGRTEAAVQAALGWLGSAQAADGRWDASDYGSGRDLRTDGHARQGAGSEADTGMTGLSLLAFLASGHTHKEGPRSENVYRGLRYLLEVQGANGNLGGRATTFEFMYCHAIATFALSEAWGMSGDEALRGPLQRALAFTITAQNRETGGWRYWPGDAGDTSQLGWQFMALKSAELAGIPMPENTRRGIIKFLSSVAGGEHGGLACYRPNERYTRTMTAEAIACWQFLGMPREHPAGREAGDFLMGELPGQATPNVYYWYYATLAMYQLGGIHWSRWNEALRSTLVSTQKTDGPLAGSWDPDPVWGGYGGRVFSTALSTLCLEVYYRFLPLYREAAVEDRAR